MKTIFILICSSILITGYCKDLTPKSRAKAINEIFKNDPKAKSKHQLFAKDPKRAKIWDQFAYSSFQLNKLQDQKKKSDPKVQKEVLRLKNIIKKSEKDFNREWDKLFKK